MSERSAIFISAVSSELGSFRRAVRDVLLAKDVFPIVQDAFPTDYRQVRAMLTGHIARADAVICLVGFAYGAEPRDRPEVEPQRSYTQLEYDIARELDKPVYSFLSDDATRPSDAPPYEPDPKPGLQLAHRRAIQERDDLWHVFKTRQDLELLVAKIPPVATAGFKMAPTHLRHGAEFLFGRAGELARLDVAWDDPKTHVVTIVAWGGVGKTALVFEWMARLAADGWRGAERVFDWSFYSQGTRDQTSASGDLFVFKALEFFGDPDPTLGSPWDKGERLARLVAAQKTLLVLDGLEPLQHPPGSYGGVLKDPTVACLFKGLAQHNPGLCLVTTREPLVELAPWHGTTAPEWLLERLSEPSGAALLHRLGADRINQTPIPPDDPELLQTTREVDGHALTLQLLGRFLAKAHQGDVRRRDRVRFDKADAAIQGGHAFKVMAAYEQWLAAGGQQGERQLAVLRLMGLFDRPADPGPLAAVCQAPAIPSLTEPLAGLAEEDWNLAIADLEEIDLLRAASYEPRKVKGFREEQVEWHRNEGTAMGEPAEFDPPGWLVGGTGVSPVLGPKHGQDARATRRPKHGQDARATRRPKHGQDARATGPPGAAAGGRSLEAHPLVRDYFAQQLRRTSLASWQEAHRRVYAYLTASVPYWPEGSEGLQPLYQAVAHGCQAGLHQEACDKVYFARIQRRGEAYSTKKLGAAAADLGAVACFFDRPWTTAAPSLSEPDQSWVLAVAAFSLRALGRLQEALEPMRAALKMAVAQEHWNNAARGASNLSELELTLGDVAGAVRDAHESVDLADRSGEAFMKMVNRTVLADALHESGRQAEALEQFRQAEAMQGKGQPQDALLYSLQGFRYCDLLLAEAERAAWGLPPSPFQGEGRGEGASEAIPPSPPAPLPEGEGSLLARCREVEKRGMAAIRIAERNRWLLDIALDHLTLGRAALYRAVLARSAEGEPGPAEAEVNVATGSKPTGCNPWDLGGFFARPRAGSEVAEILQTAQRELAAAVDGLRHAGQQDELPRGLLSRAWLRGLEGDAPGARADLDEAWQTAERGGMRLFMADVLLYRARLSHAGPDRPAALADLAAARKIIDQCEYHRRDAELAAAEAALGAV